MGFELNDERATDILIWWLEGTDGSIDYDEEQEVKRILQKMSYSPETFYEDTLLYISGLSSEDMDDLIDQAITWGADHFGESQKELTLMLLENVALSNGKMTDEQKEKLEQIGKAFGIS